MDIKSVLIPAVALFFPIAAVTVYTDVIRSFIGVVSTKSNVAFYVQADMLIKVILTVITSIGTIMMPHITRLLAEGKFDEVNRLIKKSFQFISFISFPIMFGVFVISENFIILFLGKNFIPAAKLMSIDAISIIFAAWSNVLGQQYMIPNKKLKEYTLSTTIPVTTIIFTLPILYYAFGVPGVMLAIVIVQLLIFLLQLFYCRSILNTKELFNGIPKIFLASIVMAVGIIMVNNVLKIESRFVFLSIDIILGALIYGITGIVLKIPEIDTFKNLILKNRK